MPSYRFVGDTPKSIPSISVEVNPGDVFESPVELNGPEFDVVTAKAAKASAPPPEEPAPAAPPNPSEEVQQ